MVRPIQISVVADADKARKELSSLGDSMKTGLKVAAAAGAAGIVMLAKSAVTAASDAQQSIGATEAIYEKYASTVIKRSNEAADAVGLSANAYRESSNLLGALFKNQGVELKRLSSTTDEHLKLASDLSAMYGGPVTDAVEALTAAYKGEFNQLEKYGVTLKQDTINTAANQVAKRKFGKELKKLSPAQESVSKQLATQQLLFKQTKDAAGAFGRESNTVAGQQQRLQAELDNVKAEIGTALLPVLTDLAKWARSDLVPAFQDFARWLSKNEDEIQSTSREIGSSLLPVLETTGKVVGDTVRFFSDLPGPVKEIGVQVGIAALVLPRLSAGLLLVRTSATVAGASMVTFGQRLAQNRAAMTYATGVYGKTAAALHGFGGAARSVAGIGGFLALTQGANNANEAISTLAKVGGAALIGFSVAGPVGGAIGAVGGLAASFNGLKKSIGDALLGESEWNQSSAHIQAIAQERAKAVAGYADSIDRLRSSLNQFTGAVTAQTRITALDELERQLPGVTAEFEKLGISQRTLAKAATGNANALAKVNSVYDSTDGPLKKLKFSQHDVADAFDNVSSKTKVVSRDIRDQAKVTQDLSSLLGKLPKDVFTKIEATGIDPTVRGVAKVAKQYNLVDKKQIKALIQATGIDATVKDVERVKSRLRSVGDVKPNIANGPFGRGVSGDLSAIARSASAQANRVGSNLGSGMLAGVSGWASAITGKVSSIVNAAVAAGHRAADSHSPSRKTMQLGDFMGQGLVVGLERSRPKARTAGQKLVQSVLGGVGDGAEGVSSAIEKVTAAVRKAISGKNEGKREAAYLKSLRDEYAALRRNGRAQDAVAAKLEKARDRLKELTDQFNEYRTAIADSIRTTGDVTQLGRQDDGTVSVTSLLNELKNKVVAAQRFSSLMQQLAQRGLSQTSIQQMLDAGPAAALATAEAIASGGASTIAEINALQAELAKTGNQLGGAMADRYYGAGVQAARGIVKGLESEAKNLDRAAVRMANQLVRAVKRALGIKSPSREFRSIADQVTAGLTLQLRANGTYVKRTGAVMASQLEKGFGTPALEAFASQNKAGASQVLEIRLTPDQVDRLSRGRQLVADIDYAIDNGVRPTRIGVG